MATWEERGHNMGTMLGCRWECLSPIVSLSHCAQVFVSKDVAKHLGFQSAVEALRGLYSRVRKG